MYSRYPVSTHALLCLLLFIIVGCEQSSDVTVPSSEEIPTGQVASPPKTNDLDSHHEQLLRKRLEFESKIREAMDLYRSTSQKVREQRTQLKKYLGNKSVLEAVELFSKGKPNEIPSDLRAAHSCWRTLIPDETQRLQITVWIDRQQVSGVLEELDIQIKEFENRRQLGRILDQNELAEIDRLLARPVVGWETFDASDRALLEQEAIEKLKSDLANWE
jgi:hypothetical protein